MNDKFELAIRLNDKISDKLESMINDNLPADNILHAMIHYHNRYHSNLNDLIVCRMVITLEQNDFVLSKDYLIRLHKLIFVDNEDYHPGLYRNYDISLKSKYLNDKRVIFSRYYHIDDYLNYDFNEEIDRISYDAIDNIKALSNFMVKIWNIHPFCKGNMIVIIVFFLKYLDANYIKYDLNYLINNLDMLYQALILASDNQTMVSDDKLILLFMKEFLYR